MQIVKFSCPNCRNSFTLKTPNVEAVMGQLFRCPKCGLSTPFSSFLRLQKNSAAALHTHIANQAVGGPVPLKTRVATGANANGHLALVVESTGKRFPLMPGIHILGRDSSDSRATLKLAPDPYMSRQQARLVVEIRNGQPVCQIYALTATNATYVNDQEIEAGQPVTLRVGDKLLIGMTTVRLSM